MSLRRDGCIALGVIFAFALASCQASAPVEREVTRIVPQTVVVTEIVNLVVTATPLPPTPTPEASPTPEFMKLSTADAADAIAATGLEFADPRPMTKDDYGLAPLTAVEGVRFLVPSLCADCGGRLYSFAVQSDLQLMEDYYVELGRASAMFFSWVFVKDNILIQINGDLPEEIARQYEAALEEMR